MRSLFQTDKLFNENMCHKASISFINQLKSDMEEYETTKLCIVHQIFTMIKIKQNTFKSWIYKVCKGTDFLKTDRLLCHRIVIDF